LTDKEQRRPQFVDDYLPGIDPVKRSRHRGILRTFEHSEGLQLSNVSEYVRWQLRERGPVPTESPYFDCHDDGFFYCYGDELA